MNILLVEDSMAISDGLKLSFSETKYNLECAHSINEAKKFLSIVTFDLIILDVSLPDGNGFKFFESYIKPKNIPTIFLTALGDEDDIVKGLELGADDYITKPFSSKELVARVKRILLKNSKRDKVIIKNILVDLEEEVVKKDGKAVELTALEYNVLALLIINKNRLVKRETILDKIWQLTGNFVDDHTVTVYIKRIKDKLGDDIITTVKGFGYKIEEK
ncbi:MAG: response regulator transcription factor [Clostridia bacterium]|nr:response regulator transcription factor [Clostridia bacterium]